MVRDILGAVVATVGASARNLPCVARWILPCWIAACQCVLSQRICAFAESRWCKALNQKDDGSGQKSAIKINTKGAESEGYEVVPFGK